ncbi:shikimate kinase [Pseudorhodoferax sp.]|uniref:shikimate kinase n=1 Tax=Pseudorhodoferax sp. TaxID=1993553 RepID=UPI002DD643E0|nr:shikimate kinase [Pseudorhodoferax sp.]
MSVFLLGPGGAGKSSTGAALAQRLGLPFCDLDAQFIAAEGEPGHCIARHGYAGYAARNVEICARTVARMERPAVLALSSGFMAYPSGVHPRHDALRRMLLRSPGSFVLLPALELETCVAETVRRQRERTFARSAAREEEVIRTRFALYRELPLPKITTMRPLAEVVDDLVRRVG